MEKISINLILPTLLLVGSSGFACAESLNIYNWKNYYDAALIEEFERRTGIDVEVTDFTTVEELERAFDENADYDIVVPSHFQLPALIAQNRIERLDFSRFSNYSQVDVSLLAALAGFSRANDYAIPYLWTAVGIAYDTQTVGQLLPQEIPDSWALVFNDDYLSRLSGCGVSWIEAPMELFSLKINLGGGRLDYTSERRLERYANELSESVNYVQQVNNDVYIEGLATGELCVSMAWAGHALDAKRVRDSVNFMLPDEGGLLTIDSWVIMKDARNIDAAYRFIDFMLEARSGRRNATATNFFSHLPPSTAQVQGEGLDPEAVLGENYRRRLYFIENLDRNRTRLIDHYWSFIQPTLTE